jgi:hypothetical protein
MRLTDTEDQMLHNYLAEAAANLQSLGDLSTSTWTILEALADLPEDLQDALEEMRLLKRLHSRLRNYWEDFDAQLAYALDLVSSVEDDDRPTCEACNTRGDYETGSHDPEDNIWICPRCCMSAWESDHPKPGMGWGTDEGRKVKAELEDRWHRDRAAFAASVGYEVTE